MIRAIFVICAMMTIAIIGIVSVIFVLVKS